MIDTKPLANGGIQIEIDGKSEEMPAHIASAFISRMLFQMQHQAEQTGDSVPEGGAIIYPHAVGISADPETGEPRLNLSFGKALLVLSMPQGELAKVVKTMAEFKKPF